MTWGFSRDDVEAAFFHAYLDKGIFGVSPFESLDIPGVGRLIEIAVEGGRAARPDLKLGICGEHGGDPDSVHFFHEVGLDYVSCSPVPRARWRGWRPGARRWAGSARAASRSDRVQPLDPQTASRLHRHAAGDRRSPAIHLREVGQVGDQHVVLTTRSRPLPATRARSARLANA